MKKYILLIIASLFLVSFESNAMFTPPSSEEGSSPKFQNKQGNFSQNQGSQEDQFFAFQKKKRDSKPLSVKTIQNRIENAGGLIFNPNPDFNEILTLLKPIFKDDMSLTTSVKDYHGEGHLFYAEALWASDQKLESTPWFFEAAKHGNDDALTTINETSKEALRLFKENKIEEAIQQCREDLQTYLKKYRPDLLKS